MAPNAKIMKACKAMKIYGIAEGKVKPVLKDLLNLYDNNWEYIEDENYRVLADAIFERESESDSQEKTTEPKQQLKRYSLGSHTGPPSSFVGHRRSPKHDQIPSLVAFPDDEGSESGPLLSEMQLKSRQCKRKLALAENDYSVEPEIEDTGVLNHNSGHEGEEIADEMPQYHIPLAVVHPASPKLLCEPGSLNTNESRVEIIDLEHFDAQERETDEKVPRIDLASSSRGEVMKDVSECVLSLGTLSTSSNPVNPEDGSTTPDGGILSKQLAVADDKLHRKPKFSCTLNLSNGSVVFQNLFEFQPPIPRFQGSNCLVSSNHTNGTVCAGSAGRRNKQNTVVTRGLVKACGMEIVEKQSTSHHMLNASCYVDDITRGEESLKISLVNEINNEAQPAFKYIPNNVTYRNAYVKFLLARISDDNCCSSCVGDCISLEIPCACAAETGGEFAYTTGGLIKEDFLQKCMLMNQDMSQNLFYCKDCPLQRSENSRVSGPCNGHIVRKFIKECWNKCNCTKNCGNRVVQRGITAKLQVFMTTEGKGWGLRTLEDLPKGAFICEYVGEIVTNTELFERNKQAAGEKHTYPVLLDADWGSEGVLKDEEALCLDATSYGNVARFINHRCCDANMLEIPVEIETPDHHYYHLAFFTARKVNAYEELTWDYGIDFSDASHPVKAFKCCCGSKLCRSSKHRKRTRSSS